MGRIWSFYDVLSNTKSRIQWLRQNIHQKLAEKDLSPNFQNIKYSWTSAAFPKTCGWRTLLMTDHFSCTRTSGEKNVISTSNFRREIIKYDQTHSSVMNSVSKFTNPSWSLNPWLSFSQLFKISVRKLEISDAETVHTYIPYSIPSFWTLKMWPQ